MSQQDLAKSINIKSSGDLSTKLYYLMKLDSDGKVAVANADAVCIGTLQNKPDRANAPAEIAILGTTKVVAGGPISKGSYIVSNASGKAVARSTETNVFGIALESASTDGDIIEVLIRPIKL